MIIPDNLEKKLDGIIEKDYIKLLNDNSFINRNIIPLKIDVYKNDYKDSLYMNTPRYNKVLYERIKNLFCTSYLRLKYYYYNKYFEIEYDEYHLDEDLSYKFLREMELPNYIYDDYKENRIKNIIKINKFCTINGNKNIIDSVLETLKDSYEGYKIYGYAGTSYTIKCNSDV